MRRSRRIGCVTAEDNAKKIEGGVSLASVVQLHGGALSNVLARLLDVFPFSLVTAGILRIRTTYLMARTRPMLFGGLSVGVMSLSASIAQQRTALWRRITRTSRLRLRNGYINKTVVCRVPFNYVTVNVDFTCIVTIRILVEICFQNKYFNSDADSNHCRVTW